MGEQLQICCLKYSYFFLSYLLLFSNTKSTIMQTQLRFNDQHTELKPVFRSISGESAKWVCPGAQ